MNTNAVSKNLIYHRKLKGFTQEELSGRTQVTVRTIQRIEKGEVQPHLQTVKLLASALDIEVEDLLPLENPKEESLQKKWLLLIHATPIVGLALPFFNVLLPIFIWIHKKDDNVIYDTHGKAVINFQLSMFILFIVGLVALLTVEMYGFIFFLTLIPFSIIVTIINTITAVQSNKFFYPLAFPFFRSSKRKPSQAPVMLLLPTLLLFSTCQPLQSQDIIRLDGSKIPADSLNIKIEKLIDAAEVHGLAVVIFDNNKAVYKKSFGHKNIRKKSPFSGDTNIYGGSLSKAVFGVLVMKLVEENVINLDTPLQSYLPKKIYEYEPQAKWHDDFTDLRNDTLYQKITARMCLSHTTGFTNWRGPREKLEVKFEPGRRYSYSGEGMTYLQVVLEKILGKNIEEIAREKIFEPLGMRNSSYEYKAVFDKDFAHGHSTSGELFEKDKDNEPRAASTLETTIDDYIKFLEAVFNHKIISEQGRKELFTPQIRIRSLTQFNETATQDTSLYDDIELSYGLGWGVLQSPYGTGAFKECHGNGFQHYSILFPEAKKGVLIMSNSDNGESIFKELLELTIADTYTPWKWENYIPYDHDIK